LNESGTNPSISALTCNATRGAYHRACGMPPVMSQRPGWFKGLQLLRISPPSSNPQTLPTPCHVFSEQANQPCLLILEAGGEHDQQQHAVVADVSRIVQAGPSRAGQPDLPQRPVPE
jgi:hypothetical protein